MFANRIILTAAAALCLLSSAPAAEAQMNRHHMQMMNNSSRNLLDMQRRSQMFEAMRHSREARERNQCRQRKAACRQAHRKSVR
jgi:hypothetical protein